MNNRIQELKKQATEAVYGAAPHAGGVTTFQLNPEVFAELIVKECLDVLDPTGKNLSLPDEVWMERCMKMIKTHFGM